jgi:hypothetical protein
MVVIWIPTGSGGVFFEPACLRVSIANADATFLHNPQGAGSLLAVAHVDDAFVWLAAQRLFNDRVSIVPGRFEYR